MDPKTTLQNIQSRLRLLSMRKPSKKLHSRCFSRKAGKRLLRMRRRSNESAQSPLIANRISHHPKVLPQCELEIPLNPNLVSAAHQSTKTPQCHHPHFLHAPVAGVHIMSHPPAANDLAPHHALVAALTRPGMRNRIVNHSLMLKLRIKLRCELNTMQKLKHIRVERTRTFMNQVIQEPEKETRLEIETTVAEDTTMTTSTLVSHITVVTIDLVVGTGRALDMKTDVPHTAEDQERKHLTTLIDMCLAVPSREIETTETTEKTEKTETEQGKETGTGNETLKTGTVEILDENVVRTMTPIANDTITKKKTTAAGANIAKGIVEATEHTTEIGKAIVRETGIDGMIGRIDLFGRTTHRSISIAMCLGSRHDERTDRQGTNV